MVAGEIDEDPGGHFLGLEHTPREARDAHVGLEGSDLGDGGECPHRADMREHVRHRGPGAGTCRDTFDGQRRMSGQQAEELPAAVSRCT
jgi:hypothetical protein